MARDVQHTPQPPSGVERAGDAPRAVPPPRLRAWIAACRPAHWVKNLLVFVPVITSHDLRAAPIARSAVMFLAFSFCASAVYLLNDVADIESDRRHVRKRERAIAAGRMTVRAALWLAPVLAGAGVMMAALLGWTPAAVLAAYLAASLVYSSWLKRMLLADVVGLSMLYLARIVAGHAVTGIAFSPWQLSFALLIFISLAFGKRVSELQRLTEANRESTQGRGYHVRDMAAVRSMGIATGVAAVVVFCLYLNSDTAYHLYRQWELLWLLAPALFYWIARFWVLTERGVVEDDPIMFAAKDRVTYVVAALAALTMFLATQNLFPHLPVVR